MYSKPEYFLNREMSWLKFNLRVLQEAKDSRNPLLERLRFLAITASNLDEFFMIRVAGLKHQLESGISRKDAAGLTVEQQLAGIASATRELVKKQYHYLKQLRRELIDNDICLLPLDELPDKCREWTKSYFEHTIYPVLSPLAVDSSHPFPFLANRSLNLAIELRRGRNEKKTAVIQVPGVLPRIVEIPFPAKKRRFVFLEEIIEAYCASLFYGFRVSQVVPFRITRNADLEIDEEDAEDLLAEVEKSLRQRRRGQAVRLELGKTKSAALRQFIIDSLKIAPQDIYQIPGPVDLTAFSKFADLPGCANLRYESFTPALPYQIGEDDDIFAAIRQQGLLLHHPYDSFAPVIRFIQQAASDPHVLAIKQTLYRVGGDSPIVGALAQAAENGKQVTVLVELKARFDEENNILWAKRLEEAGCHVIYGLVGLKTHAKITLVVRREEGAIRRYVHLGTGNYNGITARLYTDIGLFTTNDQIGADASAFFNVLSGYSDPPVWNKIVVAPLGLREKLFELIDQEIGHARAGRPARIVAKMNSLVDKRIVEKLYEASGAGVQISLIVRGICVLRPGIRGISENIEVRSIVGRFLEHSRIFYFAGGGEERMFLSSADWMPRNLDERVELLFPVEDLQHIQTLKNLLELYLDDNQKSYFMRPNSDYRRVDKRGPAINAQAILMLSHAAARPAAFLPEQPFKPSARRRE